MLSEPASAGPLTSPDAARGPLVVSETNPRYFAVRDGDTERAVYLTGSHVWNNFHDGAGPGAACVGPPERNDFDAYLDFLRDHGHNFIRLWRWEHFKSQAAGGAFHLCMTPQPWPRTGPGAAHDGKPKFDLEYFDESYFERLRERIITAGNRGIYVGVMFFEGWALHLSPSPDNVRGHPFFAANNINDVGITSIVDYQVLPLDPRVQELQAAYIRKVVDTVHDLPNVLYEVVNESSGDGHLDEQMRQMLNLKEAPDGDSTEWQYWVIDVVKQYEQQMGYDRHPIGITMQYPVADQTKVNDPLYQSRADWISPGYDDEVFARGGHPMAPNSPPSRWYADPPASDGRKVIITDTDHYAPGRGDALWAWKSFLRGHHPILMDFGIVDVANPQPATPGAPSYESFEPARHAMGDTLAFAQRMQLIDMTPHNDIASTGFALAHPGDEYLILQPSDSPDPFTVNLAAGTYVAEWFSVNGRQLLAGGTVDVKGDEWRGFTPPFEQGGPAVLHLSSAHS